MRLKILLLTLAGFTLGAFLAVVLHTPHFTLGKNSIQTSRPLIGGPFSLTDHNGKRVTDQDFKEKLILIYFGFTHCPDICPGDLQVMASVLDQLGDKAARLAPLFVTVDPERDTSEVLARFIPFFHKNIIGLTGTPQEIQDVTKAYRVYYGKVQQPDSQLGYLMNHSAYMYLMNEKGQYLSHFNHGTPPEKIVETISKHL